MAVDAEPKVQTSIMLTRDHWHFLRQQAQRQGTSMSRIIGYALGLYRDQLERGQDSP